MRMRGDGYLSVQARVVQLLLLLRRSPRRAAAARVRRPNGGSSRRPDSCDRRRRRSVHERSPCTDRRRRRRASTLGLGLGGRGDWSGPLAARRRVARPSARVGPTRPMRPAPSTSGLRARTVVGGAELPPSPRPRPRPRWSRRLVRSSRGSSSRGTPVGTRRPDSPDAPRVVRAGGSCG